MATMYPWRLQGDIKKGETDPMVTVFVGPEVAAVDGDGNPTTESVVYQNTGNPAVMKLSEVAAALADPSLLIAARQKPLAPPTPPTT